jgi:acetyl esterase/lipase
MTTNSRHLVDPDLLPIVEAFPPMELDRAMLPMVREMTNDIVMARRAALPENVSLVERMVPRAGGGETRVFVFSPGGGGPRPAILHTHAGGYVMGQPEMHEGRNAALCAELGCVIVSVDYRLAPEHPYPASIDDAFAVLEWLHAHVAELGIDPERIALVGESAGGGLAAALALRARDHGKVPICFQMLLYPMLDDRPVTAEAAPYCGDYIWTREMNAFAWAALLGDAIAGGAAAYAAPARVSDLAGLPPAYIGVGALDLFLDEDIQYARRLIHAGVPCELQIVPGATHAFDAMSDGALAQRFTRSYFDALHRGLSVDKRGG